MKSIKDFKSSKFNISKIYGGWDGIIATPGGEFAGFAYESDTLVDDNRDGEWSAGEDVIFHHTDPTIEPGRGE